MVSVQKLTHHIKPPTHQPQHHHPSPKKKNKVFSFAAAFKLYLFMQKKNVFTKLIKFIIMCFNEKKKNEFYVFCFILPIYL